MGVVLLGGGGHASDVLAVLEAKVRSPLSPADGLVYVADDNWLQPERFEGRKVEVKFVESITAGARLAPFIVAVGFPGGRLAVHDIAVGLGGQASHAIVHPDASIGAGVHTGLGVVVMGQTWVSAQVRLGDHTHVGYGGTIGHDTEVGSFCSLMPGACIGGDVVIGDGVLVGANATILQGLMIGDGAVVGAGATVVDHVKPGTTVVGTPARPRPSAEPA